MNHDEIHVKVAKLLNTLDCQTTYCTTSNINGFISSRLSINSNKLIPCETKIPFKRIVYIIRLIKTTSIKCIKFSRENHVPFVRIDL